MGRPRDDQKRDARRRDRVSDAFELRDAVNAAFEAHSERIKAQTGFALEWKLGERPEFKV